MNKRLFSVLLAAVLLVCTACGGAADMPTEADSGEQPAAPTEKVVQHFCGNVCLACGLCTDQGCTETPCLEKCPGEHKEEPYPFPQGNFITTETIRVDAGILVFDIGKDIYVPGNLQEMGMALTEAMEQVSGLGFDGAGYANDFADGKVHINVTRDGLYHDREDYWGLDTNETGLAYADPREHILVTPGDLFLGYSRAIVHELGHMLMWRQGEWTHSQLLTEGFAEYTAYLAMREMDKTDTGYYMDRATQCLQDLLIFDYEKLYEKPLEYWFENLFEYGSNNNYAIGFRFMAYLDQVYGNYSGWITAFEKTYRSGEAHQDSSAEQQIYILKAVYGDDVLDNFYPWLRQNEDSFNELKDFTEMRPVTAESISLYPEYNAIETGARITSFAYNDLYINLDNLRQYITEYKGGDASDLVLITSEPVQVNLYKADGSYVSVMSNSETLAPPVGIYVYDPEQGGNVYTEVKNVLSLEDICYIKLVGEGELELLEIYGSFTEHMN